jgi:DNA-binding NarL/FixJ family response regulator
MSDVPNESQGSVLVVDDAEVIRRTVTNFLKAEPGIKVLGEASNFQEALSLATALKPDVVLLDIHMPDESEFKPEFVKSQFVHSGARVLAMSLPNPNDDASTVLAESFGAAALLDKTKLCDELVPAILQTRSRASSG